GSVRGNDAVLARDIARLVRALQRELYSRPIVRMDQLLPAFESAVECSPVEAVHRLELRRPSVLVLAPADVPVECHRACRYLGKLEHFLARLQLSLDALARRTELADRQAQGDEYRERKHVLPRNFERIRRRNEQVEARY